MLIRYRALPEHVNETIKGKDAQGADIVLRGSVHHAEMTDFTGAITRSHEPQDGQPPRHDIVIWPPDMPPRHVSRVEEGPEAGQFLILGKKYPKTDLPTGPAE